MDSTVSRESPTTRSIAEIREHVVQIEALLSYLLFVIVGLFIAFNLVSSGDLTFLIWLAPALALAGWRAVLRVTNPTNGIRNRLTWAATLGGVLGAACGAAADIVTGGLTAGQGTAIGVGVGAAIGGALGDKIESWGKRDELMQRGDAFAYLHKLRKRHPHLANPSLIDGALDNHIPRFDINQDGRWWYSRDDLDRYIKHGP